MVEPLDEQASAGYPTQPHGTEQKIEVPPLGPVHSRLEKELHLIKQKGFVSYFLINWDIVSEARRRGFFYVGRGSGANSIVAYLLRITDVDPIELDLYFERFINPKRTSPPDFDIDYSWKERDEVLDYIFKRYGEKHTALLGTISTFRDRSIIRELGKVYGLPKTEIDHLVQYPDDMLNRSQITEQIMAANMADVAQSWIMAPDGSFVDQGKYIETWTQVDGEWKISTMNWEERMGLPGTGPPEGLW